MKSRPGFAGAAVFLACVMAEGGETREKYQEETRDRDASKGGDEREGSGVAHRGLKKDTIRCMSIQGPIDIDLLSEDDLRDLNHRIVERLRMIHLL